MDEMIKYLRALVYLQAHAAEQIESAVKPEVLLGRAGLTHKEIAAVLGKSQMAVSKTISRASAARKGDDYE